MRKYLLVASVGVCALSSAAVFAQDQAAQQPANMQQAQADGQGDIVVTATRRDQALQDVPISVSAVGGKELERSGLKGTTELTQTMPALNFARINTSMQPIVRGVGTRDTATGNEANVSVYVDGVYQVDQVAGAMELLNVARVEVLRGPQGTLFGRNATGGLIHIITNDPTEEAAARFKLSYGRFDDISAQAYATAGLNDKVAFDIAGGYQHRDGYIRDLINNKWVGDRRSNSARSRLKLQPTEQLKVMLSASHSFVDDTSAAYKQPWNGNDISRSLANNPRILVPTKPRTVAMSLPLVLKARSTELTNEIEYDADAVKIINTFAYQKTTGDSVLDRNSTAFDLGYSVAPRRGGRYYQNELRFLSNGDGPLNLIGGVYYINGRAVDHTTIVNAGGLSFTTLDASQKIKSVAGFGEATWEFGSGWTLIGGLRYTYEKRIFNGTNTSTSAAGVTTFVVCTGGVPCVVSGKQTTFKNLSYRAIIQRELGDIGNVYASYSRGFKSGSFNTYLTDPTVAATRPEVLDAYEIGLKTDPLPWLRINLAAFHYDYKNMQLSARLAGAAAISTFNAANSKIDGGELEISARPVRGLNLRAFATYLNAKFGSCPNAQIFTPILQNQTAIVGSATTPVGNLATSPSDQSGSRLPRAPRSTLGGSVNYTIPTETGDFDLNLNVFRSGKFYWDFNNRTFQPAYTAVNGEIGWQLPNSSLRFAVWGKNLTNALIQLQLNSSNREDAVSYDLPRTYGISLSYAF